MLAVDYRAVAQRPPKIQRCESMSAVLKGRTSNLTGRGKIMRNTYHEVRADDYIRRIDRLTLLTGAITLSLAASLFV